ncbi:hypothetical protein PPEP_a4301 [Pseudoalteromonas peptidolytica F12-50-A1]|uniref:Uncharacterized protein n=1 Tax=Pseudoalteromonas peptidolytica F12-50-A1 TaxID=1315280 RepID=A0A8I0MZD5_9GAMM|nr:hypothetical protein [Pseudoalteromonas peptidolytica F12-50-A1]
MSFEALDASISLLVMLASILITSTLSTVVRVLVAYSAPLHRL